MSWDECETVMADPKSVRALQDELKAKLKEVIQTDFHSSYPDADNYRVAMWCGSLVMQTVVGPFAQQLRQHYESEDNTLELQVNGLPMSFVPQEPVTSTSTTTEPAASATAADVADETDLGFWIAGVTMGVVCVVAFVVTLTLTLVLYMRHKHKAKYYADTGVRGKAVTIVINPLTGTENPKDNGKEDAKDAGIEMTNIV